MFDNTSHCSANQRLASDIQALLANCSPSLHTFLLVCLFSISAMLISNRGAAILLFVCAHYSDKWRMRSPTLYFGIACAMIGIAINLPDIPPGVKYFGIFLVIGGIFAAVPGVVAWCVSFNGALCVSNFSQAWKQPLWPL